MKIHIQVQIRLFACFSQIVTEFLFLLSQVRKTSW